MNILLNSLAILVVAIGCNAADKKIDGYNFNQTFQEIFSNDNNISPYLDHSDASLSVPQLVRKYGYPIEIHEVVTSDGYILTVHRIPYGKKSGPAEGKRVAWLQHGLLCDSSNWVLNDEDKALAFVLANAGYDVWMGNARGNTYSKKHVSIPPTNSKFWDFSWHEMGIYDIPAVFDYVLTKTGAEDLYYVGHSMGTTMFFVAMAERPELNRRVRLMTALAPVAYMEHMKTPLRLISPFANQIKWILSMMGSHEFMPSTRLMELLGATICRSGSPVQGICSNVLFLIAGYNADQLDKNRIPIILGHTPAGASTKSLVHYAQGRNSKQFRKYDYGRLSNLAKYRSLNPPKYDTSKITAPIALIWGQNDWLTNPIDIQRLAAELPNVQRNFRVRHDNYNHLDFLWAKDNDVLLMDEVLEFMIKY